MRCTLLLRLGYAHGNTRGPSTIWLHGKRRFSAAAIKAIEDPGYIITSFHCLPDEGFSFGEFCDRLNARSCVIYPGKAPGRRQPHRKT